MKYENTLPTPEVVLVTPDIAREMLTHNTHNRSEKARYHQYAEDMRNGDWQPDNCDPLRFGIDGTLLDGQNRLLAVIESEATVPFLVIRGLPIAAQDVMDTGIARKFSDVLKLNGEAHNTELAAVVRLAHEWTTGPFGRLTKGRSSNRQLLRFLDEHPELRDFATSTHKSIGASSSLPASIVGLLWWVFSQIDEEDADYFFERLGVDTGHEKGQPIYELRRMLKESADTARSRRASRDRLWMMAITIKAWNAYRAGETVVFFRWKPGGKTPERFPEPK